MAPFENRCMVEKTEEPVLLPHDIGLNVRSMWLYRFSALSEFFFISDNLKEISQQHLNLLMKEPTFQNVSDHCMETHAAGPQYSEKRHRCTTSCRSLPWLPAGKHPTIFFISTLSGKSWWGAKYLIKGEMWHLNPPMSQTLHQWPRNVFNFK